MNLDKLREAQSAFLTRFPGGFSDPAMVAVKKKHNVDKLIEFTKENLTRINCNKPQFVCETLISIVSRSSMVSRFEKPRFKEFVASLDSNEKAALAYAVEQLLYGRRQQGFEDAVGLLVHHKIAKWAVISTIPFYHSPQREVFVKPTTAKGIIAYLEVKDLEYKPTPSWAFYRGYRDLIARIKKEVSPTLSPNNAALTGFLMMSALKQ